MELPGKNAQEQVILERIEGAEIGVFRKQAGIIARQVHIDHIRTFHDLASRVVSVAWLTRATRWPASSLIRELLPAPGCPNRQILIL